MLYIICQYSRNISRSKPAETDVKVFSRMWSHDEFWVYKLKTKNTIQCGFNNQIQHNGFQSKYIYKRIIIMYFSVIVLIMRTKHCISVKYFIHRLHLSVKILLKLWILKSFRSNRLSFLNYLLVKFCIFYIKWCLFYKLFLSE